ncbi:unnamed protein product [Dicrocoelium dendriticum]|nr:unnamed protein product [Dicrocoelium dendriticum]
MKSQLRVVTQDFSDFRPVPRQPPVFRPGDDFDNWEFHVSLYLSSIPEKHVGPYVLSFLSEEATRLFRATGIPPTAPASEIWESLRGLFRKQEAAVLYRQKFAARTQQSGETVEAFARALQELSLRAFPDLSNAERDKWLAERFCTGLHDRSLRHQLAGMLPCSFTDAMNKAQFHESLD